MNRLILILGDQLFHNHDRLQIDNQSLVVMIEDEKMCRRFSYHKHKLILILSAMRHHYQQQSFPNSRYFELSDSEGTFEDKLEQVLLEYPGIGEMITYEVSNRHFAKRLDTFCKDKSLVLTQVKTPGFITTRDEFEEFKSSSSSLLMHSFYVNQRKRLDILVEKDGAPTGGSWSYDNMNRKKLPKDHPVPPVLGSSPDELTKEVMDTVETLFRDHPGQSKNFWLPVTRSGALTWLDKFLEQRFEEFGPYEDAIHTDHPFLFHSVLSPLLNIGLLEPEEVVMRALKYAEVHKVHLPSVEGFIRQIIGWREFIRGIYDTANHDYLESNFFNHINKLSEDWYVGTTGIPPLDDMIKQLHQYGYAHHIQRLMVASNLMLLCEIEPTEAYRWFMEFFVDSTDWVMQPNVIGMGLFADGGLFATKPYISSSNYIHKMSSYTKKSHGEQWGKIWQALYWRFIHTNREFFSSSGRMGFMLAHLEKMDDETIKNYYKVAEEFIDRVTSSD